MSGIRNTFKQIRTFLATMVFVFFIILQVFFSRASAADLINRTIVIQSSFPNVITNHLFSFRHQGSSFIQSLQFEYCSNSPKFNDPCVPPVGLDVSAYNLDAESGVTGFVPSAATTINAIVMNRPLSAEVSQTSTYDFGNVMNPTTTNQTIFVKIGVFDGVDATGTRVDEGAVAFVAEDSFSLNAYVPPYLTFCVGITVALNCSSTNGALAALGELSTVTTSTATSQLAVATNDPDGYNTFVTGQSMTSGNNIIAPLTSQSSSTTGLSQFGMNLTANSSPSVGANPDAGVVASGVTDPSYNASNLFRFNNGDRIAGASLSTGFNRYTVSYIVNIPESQPPGSYAATLTYTAIATF